MRARYGIGPGNRSFEYIMMYLTDMDDKGLAILPSHRLIKNRHEFNPDVFLEKAKHWFDIDRLPISTSGRDDQVREIKESLEERGSKTSAFGFYCQKGAGYHILSLKPGAREEVGGDLHPSLKKLDTIVLSRLILQKSLGFTREDMDNETLFHYNSSMGDSISIVDSGQYEMAFLLNPTRIDQVKEVANNSLIMPRKSTYFYPKVLTGMVFNKIDPHETIREF